MNHKLAVRLSWVWCLWWSWSVTTCLAQSAGPTVAMPEALIGLPWAGSQCERPAPDRESTTHEHGGVRPDLRCALDVSALTAGQGSEARRRGVERTWIDVRLPGKAASDLQPDALRLPVEQLATKSFLKNRSLLLVGDGTNDDYLLAQCGRLRAEGFEAAFVLQGGWPHWRAWQTSRDASMKSAALPSAARFEVPQVWAAAHDETRLVLGLRGDKMVPLVPFSVTMDAWTPRAVQSVVEQRRRAIRQQPLLGLVLLMDSRDDNSGVLDTIRRALMPLPVAVYAGSASELERGLLQLESTWTARARGPRQPRCGQ